MRKNVIILVLDYIVVSQAPSGLPENTFLIIVSFAV